MATVAPQVRQSPATSHPSNTSSAAVTPRMPANASNGNVHHDCYPAEGSGSTATNAVAAPLTAPNAAVPKKTKTKKAADPLETSKLLAAKISQLELDRAGEKDQEAEIEREVKKANRDLSNLLSNMEAPLSRLDTVQKKYTELLADMKRLDRDNTKNKKRADQLQKEKDHQRTELSKTTSLKEKLEKLCRELQKENKKMKDEHRRLQEAEQTGREYLNHKFDEILDDVQEVIDQKADPGLIPVNMEIDEIFREKFRSFLEQYEQREIHFHSVMRVKELEVQYNMARYEQQKTVAEEETHRARALSQQVSTFSQTETELRSQLNIYVEKFKQVSADWEAIRLKHSGLKDSVREQGARRLLARHFGSHVLTPRSDLTRKDQGKK